MVKSAARTLPRQKLRPKERIKKRSEFLQIQTRGTKLQGKYLLVIVQHRKVGPSRIGVVVSTKIDKRAVKRNLLKRRLREAFRKIKHTLVKKVDLVFIARNGALERSLELLRQDMHLALKRAGLVP